MVWHLFPDVDRTCNYNRPIPLGKKYPIAKLIEIETDIDKEYDIIKINNAISYSNLTGYEKASWIKKKFNINEDELLIKWLEKNNKMIMIEEFENHHELIIPQDLIKDINFTEKIICVFEKSNRYPITKYFYTNNNQKTKIEYISDEKFIEIINKSQ